MEPPIRVDAEDLTGIVFKLCRLLDRLEEWEKACQSVNITVQLEEWIMWRVVPDTPILKARSPQRRSEGSSSSP